MNNRLIRFATLCAGLAMSAVPTPVSAAPDVSGASDNAVIGSFKLPGGAEVITSEDHATPLAVIDTFVSVGSASDFPGYQGIAAQTAMAIWNGGKVAPVDAIASLGGTSHVSIDRTVTHFQAELPSSKVAEGLAAIGDAFSHPDWAGLDLDRTTQSFKKTAQQAVADPHDRAFQLFFDTFFDLDYGHPVFGHGQPPADRGTMQAFFERYYVPARLKVVLVGDFDTGRSVGQVVRGYAAVLQRSPSLGLLPTASAPVASSPPRSEAGTVLLIGARGPDISNQREQAAIELLTKVLAGSASSRLDRALAELGNAHVASARWVRFAGPGALVIEIQVDRGDAGVVLKGVQDILTEIRSNPISLDEYAKATASVGADEQAVLHDIGSRATALGLATVGAGDPYWIRTYPEVVLQVSRQDILAVAQKYLAPADVKTLTVSP